MANLRELWGRIKQKLPYKNKKFIFTGLLLIVCIVVLLFLFPSGKQQSNKQEQFVNSSLAFDVLAYATQVADNLENTINQIKGISNAKVVVVVKQSPQVEYLTEPTATGKVVVYNKNGTAYQPVAITQFAPQITGILVVAKGVANLQLKNNLLNAISAVYNVNISCIDILEGK